MPRWPGLLASALLLTSACPGPLRAQGISGPTVSDSRVGYIDAAIPGNQLRLRYDAGWNIRRGNRAEFFYPRAQPGGPGFPRAESSIDLQDISLSAETLVTEHFSVFADLPTRAVNPDINANSAGLGDVNAGFKWAFYQNCGLVSTFQLRAYLPTGDGDRGLGTEHVSLEPALLLYARLTDRLAVESEFRYWVPIGGTDFAGDIVRYGIGARYDLIQGERGRYLSPVVEFVGWTVLEGNQSFALPGGLIGLEDAAGDTVVNVKLGVRAGLTERTDIYLGYGRPLTGDRWYQDVVRVEFRLLY